MDTRAVILAWLQRVLEARRWNAAELARQSGISPSTIGRALDPDGKFVMSMTSLARIASIAHLPPPPGLTGAPGPNGFAEREAEPYAGPVDGTLVQAANLDNWIARTRALDLAGILPGDIMQVDRAAAARADDIVCAQAYDRHGSAETVFRLYDPPYLVTRSSDPAHHRKPLLVDNDSVVIVGVLHKLVRQRG